jgi:ABC-2 type transport system ATP-binding protein
MIEVSHLTYRYGEHAALNDLSMSVPEGVLYALLGPNGSGKTTLLQILMGLRRAHSGKALVMGVDAGALSLGDRARMAYIAEGQALPRWMRLEQLERYLSPLYPTWDRALASELREEFELDPARKIGAMSRGEYMKAALLCALAPRPRLLIMDEPFTGMDAVVKDELVRGLLRSSGAEGWTVLLCSHDIGELEMLADMVGILQHGSLTLSAPVDEIAARYHHVDVALATDDAIELQPWWFGVQRAGRHVQLIAESDDATLREKLTSRFPGGTRFETRSATLRELFVALARRSKLRAVVAA